jgi:hypothetical protein
MRSLTLLRTVLTLGVCVIQAGPVLAQGTTISDTECQGLRQRLAEHARLSDGVRRAVTAQAGSAPATPAPAPAVAAGRAEAIRARLEQIPKDRQALEEQRLGAMLKFDLSRAGQIQTQIQAVDAEKANLERDQAALPASPSASPTVTTQAPASDPTARIRWTCRPPSTMP